MGNANAAFGKSKEKRTDCPLETLALVLDGSGFPKQSEIFTCNASEPATLEKMLHKLTPQAASPQITVVLDAEIATEESIAWLVENHYPLSRREPQTPSAVQCGNSASVGYFTDQ